MSQESWEREREMLMQRLQKAEQEVAEGLAEATVYFERLTNCYENIRRAVDENNLDCLSTNSFTLLFYEPTRAQGRVWAKSFLEAYTLNSRWLKDAKEQLNIIKKEAEKLDVEDESDNFIIRKRIIEAASEGLITHV